MGKMRFHIVHSVKGGCGKTAFSLFKAMELAASAAEEPQARVLLLDADLKGSGLKTLIYAKDQKTYENKGENGGKKWLEDIEDLMKSLKNLKDKGGTGLVKKTDKNAFLFRQEFKEKTVNDFLEGKCEAVSDVVVEGAVFSPKENGEDEEQTGFNGYLDFIFCSPRDKDKKALRYECGEQPLLDMGKFRLRMRKLLKGICGCGADDGKGKKDKERGQYTDVVIDMPAGDDGYALVLLELLRGFVRKREEKDEIYYYVLTSGDRSHLDAAVEILIREMEDSSKENPYDKIHLVYNEVHEEEFEGYEDKKKREPVLAPLEESLGSGASSLVEIKNTFQQLYYKFCRSDQRPSFKYELLEL